MTGEARFSFAAPDWPWSFSGKLISLVWFVSVAADSPDEESELQVVIAPGGSEMDLYAYQPEGESLGKSWMRAQQTRFRNNKR